MNYNGKPKNLIISSKNNYQSKRFNKYIERNNFEKSNIQFSEKEGKINMELINQIDLNTLFDKNNNIMFQKIVDNLVYSKYYKSDFDEEYKFLLFILFQNSLDYLIAKKNRLVHINNCLNDSVNKIKKCSNELEKKLEKNKLLIEEKSTIKNENKVKYEELKKKYEELEFKKKEKMLKNLKIENETNIKKYISQKEKDISLRESNTNGESYNKHFCHICDNKFFISEESLEEHQIKRHPYLIIRKIKKKEENKGDNKYIKKLEYMKNYYNVSYDDYLKREKWKESLENIVKKREENNINFENYIENQQKLLEEIKFSLNDLSERQNKYINEFIFFSEIIKEEKKRKNEAQKHLEKSIN